MMSIKQQLEHKLNNKTAVIGIIGLGYVGLPLAICYANIGYKVIGFDNDPDKIDKIRLSKTYIKHIASDTLTTLNNNGFEGSSDFTRINDVDAIIICVPTPLNKYREPDLSYVTSTIDSILPYLKNGQVISLESTTYPGTTEEELLPRIESAGFKVGEDIFLIYSPEREDPGNTQYTTSTIPKVCGGHTQNCSEVGQALYGQAIDTVVSVSSTKVAEFTKILENIHRAVNIGLVNEMKIVADKMGVDIHEVIEAASTKPFGFTAFYPGPGLGGHCIPIDPFYLTWKAREYGINTRFIELAGEINTAMPLWVISKVADALNSKAKSIMGSKILVVGISYKKNIDDMRESPSVELMQLLQARGALVSYSDPHVPHFPKMRKYHFDLSSVDISESMLKEYDCILIATDHDDFDYQLIQQAADIVVDTRGRYKMGLEKVFKA
ncbi:MAG: UDP-N-acetyl-D-glucosamine dehydrogenase [Gammaproteobacteria bacterium]|nr:MAG: UDP-N-acetyl-D-glucosamine dehydrogenase [Gammaproteobacteria bacterium]